MKILTSVMLLMTVLCAGDMNAKMILSSHIKTEEAAKSLYIVEKFFQKNKEAKILKEKHTFNIGMELLDKYILITIHPIKMQAVENTLQLLLKEKFPDSFIVHNNIELKIPLIKKHKNTLSPKVTQSQIETQVEASRAKQKTFFSDVDKEWVALLLLALAGLALVHRSAQQLIQIRVLQKEVAKYQIILEDEVNSMGLRYG